MTKFNELLTEIDADIAAMDEQIARAQENRARLHYKRSGMIEALDAIRADGNTPAPEAAPYAPGTPDAADADAAPEARRTRRDLRQVVLGLITSQGSTVEELARAADLRSAQVESALDRLGDKVIKGTHDKWFRLGVVVPLETACSGPPTPREPPNDPLLVAATTKTDTDALDFLRRCGSEGASETLCVSLTPPISVEQLDRLLDEGKIVWGSADRRYRIAEAPETAEAAQ